MRGRSSRRSGEPSATVTAPPVSASTAQAGTAALSAVAAPASAALPASIAQELSRLQRPRRPPPPLAGGPVAAGCEDRRTPPPYRHAAALCGKAAAAAAAKAASRATVRFSTTTRQGRLQRARRAGPMTTALVTGVGGDAPPTSCATPASSPGPSRGDPVAAGCEDPLRELDEAAAAAPPHCSPLRQGKARQGGDGTQSDSAMFDDNGLSSWEAA